MAGQVVITRPRAQAEPLARRVADSGRQAVVLPLLDIEPLADTAPLRAALARLAEYAMVAFVSPNAIDFAFEHIDGWPAGVEIAVVGEGSRAALARHGITPGRFTIHSPEGAADSEHLVASLDKGRLAGRRVLIVRGETGRELLGDALRAAGAEVATVAAYRRSVPALTADLAGRLRALLGAPNDWVVTSSEALRGLDGLVRSLDGGQYVDKMQQQHFIVPHARIEQTARELGLPDVTLASHGDEGIFAALQSRV